MSGTPLNTTNWKGSHNIVDTDDGETPTYCINGIPLNVTGSDTVVEVSSNYTVTDQDDIVVGTGTFTITLLPLANAIKMLTLKSVLGGGTITIDADGAETIEGSSTFALTAGTSITLSRSASGWLII